MRIGAGGKLFFTREVDYMELLGDLVDGSREIRPSSSAGRRGLTFLELLVAVAILGLILTALLVLN